MVVLYGDLANLFVDAQTSSTSVSGNDSLEAVGAAFSEDIGYYAAGTAVLGLANLASAYVFVTCLNLAAAAQVHRYACVMGGKVEQAVPWTRVNNLDPLIVRTVFN